MNILFCTDGSQTSYDSLKNLALFLNDNATVDILFVSDWHCFEDSLINPFTNTDELCKVIKNNSIKTAKEVIKSLNYEAGFDFEVEGSPQVEILNQLKTAAYDLAVLGSHGKRGIKSWLGSTSLHVANQTKTPLFVGKKLSKAKNVLFALDGDDASYNALNYFLNKFDYRESGLNFIVVKDDLFEISGVYSSYPELVQELRFEQNKVVESILENGKKMLKLKNAQLLNEYILTGNVSENIVNVVKEEKIDLVVIGKHRKTMLEKIFLGSNSNRILTNVGCSVLIVI